MPVGLIIERWKWQSRCYTGLRAYDEEYVGRAGLYSVEMDLR